MIMLEKLVENYKTKVGEIKTADKLLKLYNPWCGVNLDRLIDDFFNSVDTNSKDFSWLNIDKKLLELPENFCRNIHYGIPSHLIGDIDNGSLFLCLVNPNIEIDDKFIPDGIFSYYKQARELNSNDDSMNIIDDRGFRVIDRTFIKRYIVNSNKNILYSELLKLKKLKELGIEYKKIKLNNIAYYFNNYVANITISYLNNIKNLDKKYKTREDLYNNIVNDWEYIELMTQKIVNLEAYPFRSNNPNFTKDKNEAKKRFANNIVESTSCVSLFSSRIILWKIVDYLSNPKKLKPNFIFRRFNTVWLPSLISVLRCDLGYDDTLIESTISELHKTFFLTIETKDFDGQRNYTDTRLFRDDVHLINGEFNKFVKETLNY
ncbi:MAG: hypothetical protein E7J49_01730 [Finegoldia magna]|uniref:Uncharacterized protein n=2 Tax=Bacillota TaxID=1239 RepID=A0ABR5TKZ7_9BACL|nr:MULTISPECIES: hypothetical protein [Bacillota]KXB57039.1 hypothetical protein HMPREF1871_00948 [Gemella asaccharolytica]MDU7889915.1 hypothetical protein [Finegoldia magna]